MQVRLGINKIYTEKCKQIVKDNYTALIVGCVDDPGRFCFVYDETWDNEPSYCIVFATSYISVKKSYLRNTLNSLKLGFSPVGSGNKFMSYNSTWYKYSEDNRCKIAIKILEYMATRESVTNKDLYKRYKEKLWKA